MQEPLPCQEIARLMSQTIPSMDLVRYRRRYNRKLTKTKQNSVRSRSQNPHRNHASDIVSHHGNRRTNRDKHDLGFTTTSTETYR